MNRLQFRAWSESHQRYFYGNQLVNAFEYYTPDGNDFYLNAYTFDKHSDYEQLILEQWTELEDKNGVKIFEGDIVKYKNGDEYSVAFVDFKLCEFRLSTLRGSHSLFRTNSLKIIGNIHQHGDLLK